MSDCVTLVRALALLTDEACQVSTAARSQPTRPRGSNVSGSGTQPTGTGAADTMSRPAAVAAAAWSPWARRQELLTQLFTIYG